MINDTKIQIYSIHFERFSSTISQCCLDDTLSQRSKQIKQHYKQYKISECLAGLFEKAMLGFIKSGHLTQNNSALFKNHLVVT